MMGRGVFVILGCMSYLCFSFESVVTPMRALRINSDTNSLPRSTAHNNNNNNNNNHNKDPTCSNESLGYFQDIDDHEWNAMMHKSQQMQHDALQLAKQGHLEQGETLFDYFDPDFSCRLEQKVGGLGDGGKWVCDPHRLMALPSSQPPRNHKQSDQPPPPNCLVYSVGSHGDFSFEQAVHREIGTHCEVHTFDFGDFGAQAVAANATYHPWGFADTSFIDPAQGGRTFKTMPQTVEELGHTGRTIDLFKIDCEGCEWQVYPTWLNAGVHLRQILVEMHGNKGDEITRFFQNMYDNDYVVFHKEANTRFWRSGPFYEYSFLKLSTSRRNSSATTSSLATSS